MIHGLQCWVINQHNEVLLLKRSPDKKLFPEFWAPVAAAPIKENENIDQVVHRELLDETGYDGVIVFGDKIESLNIQGEEYAIHSFVAKVDFTQPKLNSEHTEWKFVPYKDVTKYKITPQSLNVLVDFFNQSKRNSS